MSDGNGDGASITNIYEHTESLDLVEHKIAEVKSVTGDTEANKLLAQDDWSLIETHAVTYRASDSQPPRIAVVYVFARFEDEVIEHHEVDA